MHSSLTYTHFMHILHLKRIHVTCHTRNQYHDSQNSGHTHGLIAKNITKHIASNTIIYRELMVKNHARNSQKNQNVPIKREIYPYHFYQS